MNNNCFDGYLTHDCDKCPYWRDGSDDSIGCAIPLPIMYCPAFKETELNSEEK